METYKSLTFENMYRILHCILVFGINLNKFIFQLVIKHLHMRIQNLIILLPIKLFLRMNFKIFFREELWAVFTVEYYLWTDCKGVKILRPFLIPHLLKFYTSRRVGLKCTLFSVRPFVMMNLCRRVTCISSCKIDLHTFRLSSIIFL